MQCWINVKCKITVFGFACTLFICYVTFIQLLSHFIYGDYNVVYNLKCVP